MKVKALERAVPKHAPCLLDTSFVLSYLTGTEPSSDVAAHVVDEWLVGGRNTAIVSAITAMEACVRPIRSKNQSALQNVMDFFRRFPNLHLVPVDASCAFEAARVRASSNLSAPDALILASGLLRRAQIILTNDRAWKSRIGAVSGSAQVAYLEDFA